MSNWFEKAERELEDEYEQGGMSLPEFREAMADLRRELQGQAEEAALDAYDEVMHRF